MWTSHSFFRVGLHEAQAGSLGFQEHSHLSRLWFSRDFDNSTYYNTYLYKSTMGLESTSTPPTTVSREEHTSLTSSTPQSFGDIPPVLRFEDNVEITLTQSESEGGSSSGSVSYEGRVGGRFWVTEQYVPLSNPS